MAEEAWWPEAVPAAHPRTAWRERTRQILPVIAAAAAEIERERRLPERLVTELKAGGFFGLLVPRMFGGAELDPPAFVEILEAIATIDASTAWCLGQTNVCNSVAAFLSREAAQEIFGGPTPAIIAWGAGFGGRAEAVPGGYCVSGKWSFASGGHHATWFGGHSIVTEGGKERRGKDGAPVTRTMLFPSAATSLQDIWHVIGLCGTGSDAYAVENLFVPEAHSLARDDPAERRYAAPLYLYPSNSLYGSGFAGVAVGIARAMLDALVVLAREKTPRGLPSSMRASPVSQYEIAHAEARLRAARMYLLGTVSEVWQSVLRTDRLTLEERTAIRLAATYVIHEATAVANFAYHWAGATAIFETSPFERRFRDIHAVAQQMQGRASHFETAGRLLLGLEADTAFL
ncbi:MAG: acyl-CoA dehydrogenase family protein [Acetobacteraceae bacterium]